jgi:hypothetical protein
MPDEKPPEPKITDRLFATYISPDRKVFDFDGFKAAVMLKNKVCRMAWPRRQPDPTPKQRWADGAVKLSKEDLQALHDLRADRSRRLGAALIIVVLGLLGVVP